MNEMLLISCTLNILIQKKSKYNYNKPYYFCYLLFAVATVAAAAANR